jgi:hypothetical protein
MEILAPDLGLLLWSLLALVSLALMPIALIILLRNNNADKITKMIWVIVIVFVPTFGPLIYLVIGRKQIKKAIV